MMASPETSIEALSNLPAIEPNQDQRPNEQSKIQVRDLIPPHAIAETPAYPGDTPRLLGIPNNDGEIKIPQTADILHFPTVESLPETSDRSNNLKLPALIIKTTNNNNNNNNDSVPKGKLMRTEIPDSDDYSEYFPDDDEVVPVTSEPSENCVKSEGSVTGSTNSGMPDMEQQQEVYSSKSLLESDQKPIDVSVSIFRLCIFSSRPGLT